MIISGSELLCLADNIHEKAPVHDRDSFGGSSVISQDSRLSPRKAPASASDHPPIPPNMTGKASPQLVLIPLAPLTRSPSSLSFSTSFSSSYHSDD